ncbi:hypothetical protein [Streptomyces siamensis]|uniref:Uncharacterized protein n=1 Tax=Streptomyces siamensis TaxID=1274986 RepID=A0ABP9J7V8_9ACTN
MTTTPDSRRSTIEGAVQVPNFQPGRTHSHSTNTVSEPGAMPVTGSPSNAQNRSRCFQPAA